MVITAVKKAEDDNGVIVRWYEWAGKQTTVNLALPPGAQSAQLTNLMEQPEGALTLAGDGRHVGVPTKPFEIRTVKVMFK